ncbi:MAG: HAMP domain-containing histidine kinase [Merismopedia sp. SIO2A8]|nr:HAMP domain-containing histidine kinase [Merismopedia sp. SIO2A8]
MQVGSEFLHLCQEQVHLLVQGLGASLAVVALVEHPASEKGADDLTFVPVITYPDAFNRIDPNTLMAWLAELWLAQAVTHHSRPYNNDPMSNHGSQEGNNSLFPSAKKAPLQSTDRPINQDVKISDTTTAIISGGSLEPRSPLTFPHQEQMVMPLTYQDAMVGILVTARMDRGWNQLERYDVQRIAQTISAACVLDQRSQWLEQRLHQQSMAYARLYEQQEEGLADILHQLRNPLTAVRTFGKLLLKRLQPADRNRAVAESIVRESDRLQELLQQLSTATVLPPALPDGERSPGPLNIVNGDTVGNEGTVRNEVISPLLTDPSSEPSLEDANDYPEKSVETSAVSRLTGEPIHLAPISMIDILAPLMVSAHAIAQERNLTLHVTSPDTLPPVWADAKAVREVLNNLLDNALKYTPPGGDVHVIVGIDGNESIYPGKQGIAIADTGPGIPPEDQPHLFARHFRGVQAQGNIPGTGLGLEIAQLLMHQMQGKISVFSPISACPIPLNHLELPNYSNQDLGQNVGRDSSQNVSQPVAQSLTSLGDKRSLIDRQRNYISKDVAGKNHCQHTPLKSEASTDRLLGTLFIVWLADHLPKAGGGSPS